jgi:3-mercaptopyruvate sulfurtransferase SseA
MLNADMGTDLPRDAAIDCAGLNELLARDAATVVDLAMSRDYLSGHIPGAWFAIRTRLDRAFKTIPHDGTLVLTSEDGTLASLAVTEASALTDRPVRYLTGGNAAWRAAGYSFSTDAKMADEPVDQWRKPYERAGNAKAMMQEYLDWEVDLLPRIKRDGSLQFDRFRPRLPIAAR